MTANLILFGEKGNNAPYFYAPSFINDHRDSLPRAGVFGRIGALCGHCSRLVSSDTVNVEHLLYHPLATWHLGNEIVCACIARTHIASQGLVVTTGLHHRFETSGPTVGHLHEIEVAHGFHRDAHRNPVAKSQMVCRLSVFQYLALHRYVTA